VVQSVSPNLLNIRQINKKVKLFLSITRKIIMLISLII